MRSHQACDTHYKLGLGLGFGSTVAITRCGHFVLVHVAGGGSDPVKPSRLHLAAETEKISTSPLMPDTLGRGTRKVAHAALPSPTDVAQLVLCNGAEFHNQMVPTSAADASAMIDSSIFPRQFLLASDVFGQMVCTERKHATL